MNFGHPLKQLLAILLRVQATPVSPDQPGAAGTNPAKGEK